LTVEVGGDIDGIRIERIQMVRVVEETMTFKDTERQYGWKYAAVRRHFKDHPLTLVKWTPNPLKRPKKGYRVPISVVISEWKKMRGCTRDCVNAVLSKQGK